MVKNPRKKASPSRIRPLNRPELVQVEEGRDDRPTTIVFHSRRAKVTSIEDVWEIVDEWWRGNPIARRYYQVGVEGGATMTVFRDLVSGAWYRQQAYGSPSGA